MLRKFYLSVIATIILNGTISADSTPQWPFDRPSIKELQTTQKKVFSHYFSPYPTSLDNKIPDKDYYAVGFNSPDGEKGKHKTYGGFFRQRPLPRMPRSEINWQLEDMIEEVKMARDLGTDGFCYDILSTSGTHWERLLLLLEAVNRTDRGFKIMLMPDMTAQFRKNPELMVPAILKIADNPALYRLDDGRLVIAPFNAYAQTPEWWKQALAEFEEKGVKVAFMPLFQGWWNYIDKYRDVSFGFSDWGCSTFEEQHNSRRPRLKAFDRQGLKFMAPVRPQDFRPKNFNGSEGRNSELFREMWQTAMEANAEWVQLITWNDYSESAEIVPSTGTRHTFYDLSAYYTTWFKTGKQPEIVRDAIYYFYRTQPTDAKVDLSKQEKKFRVIGPPCNEIELLAFMKQPGTLEIRIDSKTFTKDYPAGINSFTIPLANGRPEFKLSRNGKTVIAKTGAWEISDKVTYDNLLVHGDGGTAEVVRDYSSPRVPPKAEIIMGKLLKKLKTTTTSTFEVSKGEPASLKIQEKPYDRAKMTIGNEGEIAIIAGPGQSSKGGTLESGEPLKLDVGQELVFNVRNLEMRPASGWIAVFLSIGKQGGGKISITLRNPAETYISSTLPTFKVIRGNFPVEYPAVYRIRKNTDSLEFVYGNTTIYTFKSADVKDFETMSIYVGCEKADAAVLLDISSIELRQTPLTNSKE